MFLYKINYHIVFPFWGRCSHTAIRKGWGVQVLSTWRGMETGFDGSLLPSCVLAMEGRSEACDERLAADADRPRVGPLTKKYISNREHCMAADAEIRSVTAASGYKHFAPESVTGPLGPDEERYEIALVDLPDEIRKESYGLKFRSAIHNKKTGDTRLEVDWESSMPSVWACSDMGSDTWQHKLKLMYKYAVRGSEKFDPPHRTVRNREKALSKCKGTFVKTEFGIVFSSVRGPWSCESNLQLLRGGTAEMFKHFTWKMPLFSKYLYYPIVRAKYANAQPLDFGTDEHKQKVWEEIQDDRSLQGLSEDYATNRWKCWTDRYEFYEDSFDIILLSALYILITRGTIKNYGQDLPGLVGIQKWIDAGEGLVMPEGAAEMDIKGLKEASKALEARRAKGSSSLLSISEVLVNKTTRRLGHVTARVPKFSEGQMMKDISASKTQSGAFNYHVDQACGSQLDVVKSTLGLLEDKKFLREAQFIEPDCVVGKLSLRECDMVAKYTFDFVKHLAVHEIQSSSFYSERPPYRRMLHQP